MEVVTAITRVEIISSILTGFHLRHKNQHRVSTYWWPAFGQLRRHVRRLGEELVAVKEAIVAKNVATRKTTRQKATHRQDAVRTRARWLQAEFVPKAYLAFSRLVADRQFAPLGLLLVGVLAQLYSLLQGLLETMAPPNGEPVSLPGTIKIEADLSEHDTIDKYPSFEGHIPSSCPASAVDTGVAVARNYTQSEQDSNWALITVPPNHTRPSLDRALRAVDDNARDTLSDIALKSKTCHSLGNNYEANRDKMREDSPPPKNSDRKSEDKPTKKRKRSGDEFDALFSGLL